MPRTHQRRTTHPKKGRYLPSCCSRRGQRGRANLQLRRTRGEVSWRLEATDERGSIASTPVGSSKEPSEFSVHRATRSLNPRGEMKLTPDGDGALHRRPRRRVTSTTTTPPRRQHRRAAHRNMKRPEPALDAFAHRAPSRSAARLTPRSRATHEVARPRPTGRASR